MGEDGEGYRRGGGVGVDEYASGGKSSLVLRSKGVCVDWSRILAG